MSDVWLPGLISMSREQSLELQRNAAIKENAALRQQLAEVKGELDEQCEGKIAFFNGMNDMREQRTALERQLAKARSDTQYHMDCITLLAKHIGRLGEPSYTVVTAAIQQLATVTQAVWAELRTAISNGKFIPLDTSFKTKEMFEIIHWIEAYIDEQAKKAQP